MSDNQEKLPIGTVVTARNLTGLYQVVGGPPEMSDNYVALGHHPSGPDILLIVPRDHVTPLELQLSRIYPATDLTSARQVRQLRAQRATLVAETCVCAWPLVRFRNGHGHDSRCPAASIPPPPEDD